MKLNRLLGIEIYIIHIGHFLLFIAALVILALNVPWWAVLVAAPLVALGVLGWLYEASIVLPAARQLLKRADDEPTDTNPSKD
jgi:hypothetical protein